jgi:hypothetical protein
MPDSGNEHWVHEHRMVLGKVCRVRVDEKAIYCASITAYVENYPKEMQKRHHQMMLSLGPTV